MITVTAMAVGIAAVIALYGLLVWLTRPTSIGPDRVPACWLSLVDETEPQLWEGDQA